MSDLSFVVVMFIVFGLVGLNAVSYYSHKLMVLPDIIWVLLAGLAYGIFSTHVDMGLPKITLNAHLVLYVFVPLLIFASTQKICLHHIRDVLLPASLIASLGILVGMVTIAAALHYGLDIPWLPGLLFGVVLSATDPLAIGALLQNDDSIAESRKLLIEGESILNDGFVVTVFGVLSLLLFDNQVFNLAESSLVLLIHVVGALLVGTLAGRAARKLLAVWHEEHFTLRTNMTLALAYGSFVLAESLHFSGILAVFSAALAFGYKPSLPDQNTATQASLWNYFEYLANACLFFLLGASVSQWVSIGLLGESMLIVSVCVLFFGRFFALLLLYPAIRLDGHTLSKGEFWLLNFAGTRGAVSIALILLLPETFEFKSLFLSMAFVMILFSLVCYPLVIQKFQKNGVR